MVDKICSQQLNLRNYFVCYVTSFCKILNYFVHIIKRVNFLDYEVFAKQSFTVLTKIGKNKQTNREALLQVNLSYDTEIFNNLFSFGLCLFNSKSSNIANCKFQNPPPHHFLVFLSKRENISRTVKYSGAVSLEALTKFSKFFWDFSL